MRPGRARPGCLDMDFSKVRHLRVRFNEAGARAPRMPAYILCPFLDSTSFNEAGARAPRMPC